MTEELYITFINTLKIEQKDEESLEKTRNIQEILKWNFKKIQYLKSLNMQNSTLAGNKQWLIEMGNG